MVKCCTNRLVSIENAVFPSATSAIAFSLLHQLDEVPAPIGSLSVSSFILGRSRTSPRYASHFSFAVRLIVRRRGTGRTMDDSELLQAYVRQQSSAAFEAAVRTQRIVMATIHLADHPRMAPAGK